MWNRLKIDVSNIYIETSNSTSLFFSEKSMNINLLLILTVVALVAVTATAIRNMACMRKQLRAEILSVSTELRERASIIEMQTGGSIQVAFEDINGFLDASSNASKFFKYLSHTHDDLKRQQLLMWMVDNHKKYLMAEIETMPLAHFYMDANNTIRSDKATFHMRMDGGGIKPVYMEGDAMGVARAISKRLSISRIKSSFYAID